MLSERLFKTDEQLGYCPIPNNTGLHSYHANNLNINIPAVTDNEGHAHFLKPYEIKNDSLLLFLAVHLRGPTIQLQRRVSHI